MLEKIVVFMIVAIAVSLLCRKIYYSLKRPTPSLECGGCSCTASLGPKEVRCDCDPECEQ